MANFFSDNADLQFQFERLDLEEAVKILEHGYSQTAVFPDAPEDYEDAMDLYAGALELLGDISANFIAPRAMKVDMDGATFANGKVEYAKETMEQYKALAQAGFTGVVLPRQHGGINFPATIYFMMIEMVSRADASLMTMFGYQDIGETIYRFGTEEQAAKFLPKYAAGEHIAAMVLTEPAAGSDLQSVQLQAFQDDEGQWRLRGTKHFISNGCGDLLLVLARSEPKTTDLFGLSLFAVHPNGQVNVNRIEHKMGLHGSPTCELYFDDAPAELIGRRRFGLFNVLFALNQARFSVAAQGLGIAEAAYAEALAFAKQREQFGKLIIDMPPVTNLLLEMRVAIESSRSMLYQSAQWLDLRNKLEEQVDELKKAKQPYREVKSRFNKIAKVVDLLSPMVKYLVTETAVKQCYIAQQLHGGMGYMREMTVERLVRDVRITTIYEGTSQVQIGASYKGVLADQLAEFFAERGEHDYGEALADLAGKLQEMRTLYQNAAVFLREQDEQLQGAAAKDLVDMYGRLFAGYLLIDEAQTNERKALIARRYINHAHAMAHKSCQSLQNGEFADLAHIEAILQ